MKRTIEIVLMLTVLGVAACGGSAAPEKKQPARTGTEDSPEGPLPGRVPTTEAGRQAAKIDSLRLNEVRLSPDALTAAVDLIAEPVFNGLAKNEVTYEYHWFVNDKPVAEANGPALKQGNFKKNQWIYCEARTKYKGNFGPWLQSKFVRVADSPPQLAALPLGKFSVPGEITYQISASDPDGDALAFELLSPLDEGIMVDPKTGVLTWQIDEKKVKLLGETIEIQFAVSDVEGNKTTGTITLNLTPQKKKNNINSTPGPFSSPREGE